MFECHGLLKKRRLSAAPTEHRSHEWRQMHSTPHHTTTRGIDMRSPLQFKRGALNMPVKCL
jgi:hypothetical protein